MPAPPPRPSPSGGTRTRLTWGGQGGGNSVPLGSGCRYSPLPGRYAPADAGSAAPHAAEPVNGAGTVRLKAAGNPADREGWRPGSPAGGGVPIISHEASVPHRYGGALAATAAAP